jgi:hypothetical protein
VFLLLRVESDNFLLAAEDINLCIANFSHIAWAQEPDVLVWNEASVVETDGDKAVVGWWSNAAWKSGMYGEGLRVRKAPVEGLHCVRPGQEDGE